MLKPALGALILGHFWLLSEKLVYSSHLQRGLVGNPIGLLCRLRSEPCFHLHTRLACDPSGPLGKGSPGKGVEGSRFSRPISLKTVSLGKEHLSIECPQLDMPSAQLQGDIERISPEPLRPDSQAHSSGE